jgi:hypothetical protein
VEKAVIKTIRKRSQVQGSTFSAASDRRSGQFDRKRDSSVAESDTRVRDKDKIEDSPVMYGTGISREVSNGGQVCGDVEAVGFPVQNVYKLIKFYLTGDSYYFIFQ